MILWAIVLLPVAGGVIGGYASRRAMLVSGCALGLTAAVATWAATRGAGAALSWGPQLELTMEATGFARVMVVLVPLIALPIVVYAAATQASGRVRLIALLTSFVGAMELLVLAGDFLTLLIGWELVGAFSWLLIAHDWVEPGNVRRATHAFITTRFGDLGLYLAAGIAFASTGSFAFSAMADIDPGRLQLVAGGIVLAAAAKSAQVPFSPWLFSAMAGPTPVSALLHSSTMVAAGAYLLVRLGPQLDAVGWFAPLLIAIGLTSALSGGLVAAIHRHPKRLLAASTTAQYGLMFVAIGVGSAVAAGAQLVTHAAFKALLFLSAGIAMRAAGSEDLGDMRVGRRIPLVAALTAVGALALAALPPLGGGWSKEQIGAAAFEFSVPVGWLVLAASVLGAFYVGRYWFLAFGPGSREPRERTPGSAAVSMGFLAALSIVLGLLWLPGVGEAAAELVPGETIPVHLVEFSLGLAALGIGIGLVIGFDSGARLTEGLGVPALARPATAWFGIPTAGERLVVAPVLAISRILAAFDDRVIDAGIRASVRIAAGFSRLLRRRWEPSLDSIVNGIALGTLALATGSRAADDGGVDRTVEGVAAGVGRTGELSRKLQTGLSHHYYVSVAIGLIALVVALAMGTS